MNAETISITNMNKSEKRIIKVKFGNIDKNNIEQMRQLNNLSLPVRYQSGFYARILNKMRHGMFAFYNDFIVGAISWKYDLIENQRAVYIMTITVLEEYKRYGIGSQLLQELINIHKPILEIDFIYLHVQINNELALQFYTKSNFENVKIIENYYTDIEPRNAYLLKLKLRD